MKTTLAATLISAVALLSPVTPFAVLPASAAQCDENTPEAMKRPGGFCAQVKNLDSLAGKPEGEGCTWIEMTSLPLDFFTMERGARVHVAGAVYECMTQQELDEFLHGI